MEPADSHFAEAVRALPPTAAADAGLLGAALTPQRALELFDTQLTSRHLDLAARWLRGRGQGFYTIGSSGHEGNAAVAAALRPDDPALLHYRSGGFYVERARQVPGTDAVRDVLLGLVAATAEPISGGRHKVFGRKELAVLPQTSTIASHLPRALGIAFATSRAAKLGLAGEWPSRRRDGVQLRRRVGEPLDGDRRRQRSGVGRATAACRCRCCSCARTTASASASRRRQGWIAARVRQPPGPRVLRRRRLRPRRRRHDRCRGGVAGCAATASPRSCTCAPCGSWRTPAPTWRPATAVPSRSPPTCARDPLLGDRPPARRRRRPDAGRGAASATRPPGSTCGRVARGGRRPAPARRRRRRSPPRSPRAAPTGWPRWPRRPPTDGPRCSARRCPSRRGR